ncbi:MAG TPA: hypothetical protein VF123_03705 [Candidatus Sulfotelmatobacter sp.]
MAKRGRVLREPHAGPGLVMVEGRQYPLEQDLWRSEVRARPGLAVNVDFDPNGNLRSITAIPESMDGEQENVPAGGLGIGTVAQEDANLGIALLVQFSAAMLLLVSWCSLTAVSIHLPFSGSVELTFWQVLGYLNAGSLRQISEMSATPDAGAMGFAAILVLGGPLIHFFSADRRAALGGVLPLGFILYIAYMAYSNLRGSAYEPAQTPFPQEIFSGVYIGFGTYVFMSLAIYMAALSAKQFMVAREARGNEIGRSQEVSA